MVCFADWDVLEKLELPKVFAFRLVLHSTLVLVNCRKIAIAGEVEFFPFAWPSNLDKFVSLRMRAHVCMCVCVFVHIYTYIYNVCVCVCMHAYIHACVCVCVGV